MQPSRGPSQQAGQSYFVTFQTAERQCFFRNERWALALLNTLKRYSNEFDLHDFVIMPDHVHLLISPLAPLEKVVQLMKGGFSFNARRAFEWKGDIWQPGFSDHRIRDAEDWDAHLAYIAQNVASLRQEAYRFCAAHSGLSLAPAPLWLKPLSDEQLDGGAEASPL